MPIKVADLLPATGILEKENIFVMTEYRAMHQDIRPLDVLILNLMPTKEVTETQLLRKLSNTPPAGAARGRNFCRPPATRLYIPIPIIWRRFTRRLTRSKTANSTA